MHTPRSCYVHALYTGGAHPEAEPLPRRLARYVNGAAAAAVSAALHTRPPSTTAPERRGIFAASGPARYDAATLGERMLALREGPLWEGGLSALEPFALLRLMSCNALAVLAMALPARGPSQHHCDDGLGGLAALASARAAIVCGALDEAVVVAFDDLSSDHARAELAADGRPEAGGLAIAVAHLRSTPAPLRLDEVRIVHLADLDGAPGGASGLSAFALAVARRGETEIAIAVDRGRALIRISPTENS